MTVQDIYDALTQIFREYFLDEDLELRPDLSADNVDGWDSGANLNIMAAIEQRFRIKLRTIEIGQLANVGDMVGLIRTKLEPDTVASR